MNEKTEYEFNSTLILESLACGDPYLRRNFIGASDAPIIMGVSPWRTRYQLWQEKCGLISAQIPNHAIERGNRLEPIARDLFEKETGFKVYPKRLFSSKYEWMMCSLDGIDETGKIAVEIKCPGKYYGNVPSNYMPQLQHQMYVAELDSMYYFSYVDGEPTYIELVKRDDEYISKLLVEEAIFWELVKNEEAPEMCSSDFRQKNDLNWAILSNEWRSIQKSKAEILAREEQVKASFIEACEYQNSAGFGVKLSKCTRKGSIDYDKIDELKSLDLEKYRKAASEYWKITTSEVE